jgi:hypothetical protein
MQSILSGPRPRRLAPNSRISSASSTVTSSCGMAELIMWWIIGGAAVMVFAIIIVLGVVMVGCGKLFEASEEESA